MQDTRFATVGGVLVRMLGVLHERVLRKGPGALPHGLTAIVLLFFACFRKTTPTQLRVLFS